jgi:hypothetical protein
MADISSSGEAINLVLNGERGNPTFVEFPPPVEGVEPVRFMPGLLGVLAFGATVAAALPYLPVGLRNLYLSSLDQLHSSPTQNRLSNQVRDNGD